MRSRHRGAAWLAMVLVVGACSQLVDRPPPTVPAALPASPVAPDPTPVMGPTAASNVLVVGAAEAPQVTCGGGTISGADIDYVSGSPGVTDILAATQGFIGVRSTDVIVVEPTVTVVVRDGEPIWRGEWFDGGRGFLLGSKMSCADAGIR